MGLRMDKNWTPEPWINGADLPRDCTFESEIWARFGGGYGNIGVFNETLPTASSNSRRAVACVNGCKDIPKPEGLGDLIKIIYTSMPTRLADERAVTAALHICGITRPDTRAVTRDKEAGGTTNDNQSSGS